MIHVVCFCGSSYSFVGGAGICPECGEETSFARGPAAGREPKSAQLEALVQRSRDLPSEELAA